MADPLAPVLEVRDLQASFALRGAGAQVVKAVNGVSLRLSKGEVLGLVGESGCGKSTLARCILQLVKPSCGEVLLNGQALDSADAGSMRRLRRQVQMVFQDPIASLNPRLSIYSILSEPLLVHGICPKSEVPARVTHLMETVGLSSRFLRKFPHEFSGGQRQRIAIARALACEPSVLIADEPVSALDVSIQAQIINLLQTLVRRYDLSLVFIAHDLSVVKHISDRVAVMYLGRIVECGPSVAVIENPIHPYTRALVSAIPVPDPARNGKRLAELLEGDPPSPVNPPPGCPFHPRCRHAVASCRMALPDLKDVGQLRQVACPVMESMAPAVKGPASRSA